MITFVIHKEPRQTSFEHLIFCLTTCIVYGICYLWFQFDSMANMKEFVHLEVSIGVLATFFKKDSMEQNQMHTWRGLSEICSEV